MGSRAGEDWDKRRAREDTELIDTLMALALQFREDGVEWKATVLEEASMRLVLLRVRVGDLVELVELLKAAKGEA